MANKEGNTFADLVKQAPTRSGAEIVTLTGVLWQASDPSKFGLTLSDGRSGTFDIANVKSYLVLCSSVGETIVRIDIDASQELRTIDTQSFLAFGGRNATSLGGDGKPPGDKPPKDPIGDTYESDPHNQFYGYHDPGKPSKDPIGDTYDNDDPRSQFYGYGDPGKPKDPIGDSYDNDDPRNQFYGYRDPFYAPFGSLTPFALATPRQLPAHLVNFLHSFRRHY
jgi:hypothetical protein